MQQHVITWISNHPDTTCVIKENECFFNEYLNDDGRVYICKTGIFDPSGWENPLMSNPNMEVIYSILQIWVWVRNVYANESVCEAWVWLGECVAETQCLDALPLCVSKEYSPRIDIVIDNKHLWMNISIIIIEEAPRTCLNMKLPHWW